MKDKELDKIAAIEKAIAEKYGQETVTNPRSLWNEEKEKEYLEQMKEFYKTKNLRDKWEDKINVNGIKTTKKLLNRESLRTCPVCGNFPKRTMDDVCLLKFDCCSKCYIDYVEGREERWSSGWRPNEAKSGKS
jgi:formate dehydrogenase maturation protein FdhE